MSYFFLWFWFLCKLQSGDEMSKRTKFLFVTWLGPNVSTMKRARLSSDKALVKEIIMVLMKRRIAHPLLFQLLSSVLFLPSKLFLAEMTEIGEDKGRERERSVFLFASSTWLEMGETNSKTFVNKWFVWCTCWNEASASHPWCSNLCYIFRIIWWFFFSF